MQLTDEDAEFRGRVRQWLEQNLTGEFAALRGQGGPGREHEHFEERLAWNRHLAASGWTCLSWPAEYGGRDATIAQQVIFHEEYARAGAPARVGHMGEELLGPTLLAFGTQAQKDRFLPPIAEVRELWCQGYSEPGAGSDLASLTTSARLDGGEWVITGQKVWTSLAREADWCFLLARTEPASRRSAGLSYLLVPMHQPGITVRPIRQLTGTSEFNEVFFDGARTARDLVVGEAGDGWRVAMATLAIERGVSTLGQQVGYQRELDALITAARRTGAARDPLLRDRLARAWIGLQVMREQVLAMLGSDSAAGAGGASVVKLLWSTWHRDLGELAMDVLGPSSMLAQGPPYDLDDWQRLYLFSRADTIYGGSAEIQRGIIADRALGLPRQSR
ncbi:MAG TPA: acyl-CoA dehydrogenase family protein [Streptosporangiaceae bacterium]|nr:acyl-CoA dehydrogenase family protein [Streptosporangiaceae bacterium]